MGTAAWSDSPLNQYQLFTITTAQYPEALAMPYLGLGLGDEAGELLDKVIAFGQLPHTALKSHMGPLLAEGGDILWYLAQLLHHRGHKLGTVYAMSQHVRTTFEATLMGAATETVSAIAAIQGRLKKEIRDNNSSEEAILHNAARAVRALDTLARAFGFTVFDLVETNRAKLTSRLERGTIKGEGDVR